MTTANRANLWMADDATRRQLEQNVKARIKIFDELVPGENLYSLGPITLPARFANPQGHLFATMMSIYVVNEEEVLRFDDAEVIDLQSVNEIKPIEGSWRKIVPGAIVANHGNKNLLEFTRRTRKQQNFVEGKGLSRLRQKWHENESKFFEAIHLMQGVVDEFNASYVEPAHETVAELTIQEILTGCYAALVSDEIGALESAKEDGWHGSPWYDGVSDEKTITLKFLLEYGRLPNQWGRYQLGPMIVSDLKFGPSSYSQESLLSAIEVVQSHSDELAIDLKRAVSFFFSTFLYWEMDTRYDETLDGWNEIFGRSLLN